RDVEPERGAARGRRKERFEELAARLRRHSRPVVDNVQFYNTGRALQRHVHAYAGALAPAVAQRVATQIPHDLVEVAAVEEDLGVIDELDGEDSGVGLLDLGELLDERLQKIDQPEALAARALAAIQAQYVVHHAIEPLAVLADDGKEPPRGVVYRRLLLHELRGVA